jgi:RNA polymerase sigma-70 factor (ECF subfamily)
MLPEEFKRDIDFWNLWENERQAFFGKCLKIMNGDVCEAEDALSAAMLKAWEKMNLYREKIINFKGWALRLTENVCLDHLRKHRRLVCYDEIPESLTPEEFDQGHFFMESTEKYQSLEALFEGIFEFVHGLPRRLRDPALLRFLFSVSYRDMARRLHISEENARKRVQEVRSALKMKYGRTMESLAPSFPRESGMEPESPIVRKHREKARSVLEDNESELGISCVTACIVDALPITGCAGEILMFLPFTPVWRQNVCESVFTYLSRHPGGWKRRLELAYLLCAAGLWDQSENQFKQVLKKRRRSFAAWVSLGNMLMASGRNHEAEILFREAGSLADRLSSREYLSGMAVMCRGEWEEALKSFERAHGHEPSNVSFLHAMGICLFRAGRYADAFGIFKGILAGSPGDIVSLAYNCEISIRLNRITDAVEYIDGILAQNPDDYYGLTRKAALNDLNGTEGKEERTRLLRIAGQLEQLARMMRGSANKKKD